MGNEVACVCGQVLHFADGTDTSLVCATCGRTVPLLSLDDSPEAITTVPLQPLYPTAQLADDGPLQPNPRIEVLAPMQVELRTQRGGQTQRSTVVVALTLDAFWIQEVWQIRRIPLDGLSIERRSSGKALILTRGSEPALEKFTLTFTSADDAERYGLEAQMCQQQLSSDAPPIAPPEGVALVRQGQDIPHVALSRVEFTGPTQWAADRGAQLRAGILGADAILDLHREKPPDVGWGACRLSGLAVRVEDPEDRKRLRLRWYRQEVDSLIKRVLALLIVLAILNALANLYLQGKSSLEAPSGESRSQLLASTGLGLALVFAWPIVLTGLLWLLRWPQLLRPVGIAVLIASTGRMLTVWLTHFLVVQTTGTSLADSKLWILFDPVDWAFVIFGGLLCARAWRLGGDARQILPQELQSVPGSRKVFTGGLLAATGVYALVLIGVVAHYRYQASSHVLQPGFDPRREHEALLALNEGAARANRGELDQAERLFLKSLRLWDELTARPSAPALYRGNKAMTLYNLGWIREKQGRIEEMEKYYTRAVALADELAAARQLDDELKKTVDHARLALEDLRGRKASKDLEEKENEATRKYEEAQVKAGNGEPDAERLYREAITLWEEILPKAINPAYRKGAVARLAAVYLTLAEVQQFHGKRAEVEASLNKAVEYGVKAVKADPERPLVKHDLETARQRLEALRNQGEREELARLYAEGRYADAAKRLLQSIKEGEEQLRAGKDRDEATWRLAYRLSRFAWFIAHCPDQRVRDPRAAVKHARRATELKPEVGNHWYTLAVVQYRAGDWRDSLATLDKLKQVEGERDGNGWLLSAMNLHQQQHRQEARASLRKAISWITDRAQQAKNNETARIQYELIKPGFEALRQEAETLIEGKGG